MGQIPVSALEKAMKILDRRACSAAELRSKLFQAGFPEEEVSCAVEECKRRRFIDDTLLAEDYTALLRMRNTGSRVIRQKLARRGLAAEIVDSALPEEDSSTAEREAALRALDYKWRLLSRETDLRKKREKTFRYLAGRGFPSGLIFNLLNEKCRSDEEY